MPANTQLKIVSRANILIGGDPIPALDSSTAEAIVGEALYEDVVRDALTGMRWRFSTTQEQIFTTGATPLGRWDYEYTMPTTSMMIHAVTVNDCSIKYDIYDSLILCNSPSSDTVIADFTYRSSETSWPPYFTLAVEFSLAAMMAVAIARDGQLAKLMQQQAAAQLYKARRMDSQQQTTRRLDVSGLVTSRLS